MVKFSIRKQEKMTALSGIEIGIRSLLGAHQALITQQSEKKRVEGFEELLFDCIDYIGEKKKPELTLNNIKRLLEGDRKHILIRIRQLSNNHDPLFIFDYEFPTEDGKKLKERKTVDFNYTNFPVKPYYWVRNEMESQSGAVTHPEGDRAGELTGLSDGGNIPVMFTDYSEILEKYKEQKFVLPESGVTVIYNLLIAEETAKFATALVKERINSHTQIQMHAPVYIDDDLSVNRDKPVRIPVPLDQLTHTDIEALRKDMMEKEGSVDSQIVVQYKEDRTKQSEIDLVSMPAFFFPSLVL